MIMKTKEKIIEIKIIKKPDRPTNVEIGDIAIVCGKDQFHSIKLVDIGKKRENYWVEFLTSDCYEWQ